MSAQSQNPKAPAPSNYEQALIALKAKLLQRGREARRTKPGTRAKT